MRLESYLYPKINEQSDYGKGLTIFDIDETLLRTFSMIKVIKNGKVVKKLNNQEFNHYSLKDGESFDFGEFRNADVFYKTSVPIQKNIDKLIAIEKNATKKGSKVIMLTARADFDDKERFLQTFRKLGVSIDNIYVERAGNISNGKEISLVKKQIIANYLSTGEYRRVRLYDDHMKNCTEFLKLQHELPLAIIQKIKDKWNVSDDEQAIEFFAYFIEPNGKAKRIRG